MTTKGFHPKKTSTRKPRCCANCAHYKNGAKPLRVNGRTYFTFPRPKGRRTFKDGYCDHPQKPWGPFHSVYKNTTCCQYHTTKPTPVCEWCLEKIVGETPVEVEILRKRTGLKSEYYHSECFQKKVRWDEEDETFRRKEREIVPVLR